jgi:hypothetical protein
MRYRTPLAAVGLVALGYLAALAQEPDRHWLHRTGDDWVRFSPAAKAAYIEGYLAGAGVTQAAERSAASSGTDSGSTDSATASPPDSGRLERMRRTGALRFPYGVNVYLARVDDYYWWQNHRPNPTWFALWEVNETLIRQSDAGGGRH